MQLRRSALGWHAIDGLFCVALFSSIADVECRTRAFLRDRRQPQTFPQPGVNEPSSMLAFGGMAIPGGIPFDAQTAPNLQQSSDAGVGSALGSAAVETLETALLGAAPPKAPPLVADTADAVDDEGSSDDNSGSDSAASAQALAEDESIASHLKDSHSEDRLEDTSSSDVSDDGGSQKDAATVSGAIRLSVQPLDALARATLQVEQQTETLRRSKAPQAPPLVSMPICAKAKKKLKAMSCSLVTQISGYPEGCECRIKAKKCPGVLKDLGFTGVSPSVPFSPPQLGGASVILCMYWQWLKPPDRSHEDDAAAEETKAFANELVTAANFHAEQGAKTVATALYGMTTPPMTFTTTYPIPPTPMPIFEPVRFLSTTPYLPFFGSFGPGPAPAPGPPGYGVSFTLRVNSINYALIAANMALLNSFQDVLKTAIAQQAGVQPYHVSVRVGAGSVIVQAFISPAGGIPDLPLASKLSYSPTFLGVLTNFVNTVPGILAYCIGPISIDWISRPSIGLAPWAPSPAPMGFLSPFPGPAPAPPPFFFVPFMPFGALMPAPAPGPGPSPGPAPSPAPR